MNRKQNILFLGVTLLFISVVFLEVFKGMFDLEVTKLVSPDGKFVAYHRIAHDEAGGAPYSDYVLVRSTGLKLGGGNVDDAQFVGYCDRGQAGLVMKWDSPHHLSVNCPVSSCGIVRTLGSIEHGVQLSYVFDNYDSNVQHIDSDDCRP